MNETYFAAIDLGTNKIAGAVAKKQEDGKLIIISLEEEPTEANAVLYGLVADYQQVLFQIKRLITKLQNSSKVTINNCYIGIGGKLLEKKYPNSIELMNDVINSASKLTPAINLIEVECPILCTANAVLSDQEKNNGCLFIDFGAGCTSFVLYENGEPKKMSATKAGGNLVTKDLTDLQLPFKLAEKLKIKFGNALASTEKIEKIIELSKKTDDEKGFHIKSGQLAYIIEARIRETVDVLLNYLLSINWFNKGTEKRNVVITGGASKLTNLDTLISEKANVNVIIANAGNKIININNFSTMQDAEYSALCGMLLCATEGCKSAKEVVKTVKKKPKKSPIKSYVEKIGQGFDNLFSGKNESFNDTQENNTDK
ncbi:MAG: hypothetical protein EOL95_07640 [Bacteroidia bacterium]|nr:hypothetical protein [Bacteroidia bacterium]